MTPRIDIRVEYHGSITLVIPVTPAGEDWLDTNVQGESQWYGGALVVEPRYLSGLVDGMVNDGLEVSL